MNVNFWAWIASRSSWHVSYGLKSFILKSSVTLHFSPCALLQRALTTQKLCAYVRINVLKLP